MRKRNVGRISFFVILINIVLLFMYMADKNDENFTQVTEDNKTYSYTEVQILRDETVDESYVKLLETIVNAHNYSKSELSLIRNTTWYLTDSKAGEELIGDCSLDGEKATIYITDENSFCVSVESILEEITRGGKDGV